MMFFYSGIFIAGLLFSVYNWFYLREIETAKMQIGLTLSKKVMFLFRGMFFTCLFVSVSSAFSMFAALFFAR